MREDGFTIFLIDDDAGVLKSLGRLLRTSGYEIMPFRSPLDFLRAHDPAVPGCAVLDLAMPYIDGLHLQDKLLRERVERPIIFLSGRGDISASVKAMKSGAVDFLTKPVKRSELLAAVSRAVDMDKQMRQEREKVKSINDRLLLLTPREREVLQHVVAGRLNKQIAGALGTVEKTVKVHRGRMMMKLGVRCVADLVRLSERAGIAPEG
ncbi:MAG TPA: response regulator [Pseudolabrys sp.]|nr:response regulator [Pseudolabrys sp.]